MPNTEKV